MLRRGSDNRTFANQKVDLSPQLITELQLADLMLESAAELFPGGGYEIPAVPEGGWSEGRLASEIRSFLGRSSWASKTRLDRVKEWRREHRFVFRGHRERRTTRGSEDDRESVSGPRIGHESFGRS